MTTVPLSSEELQLGREPEPDPDPDPDLPHVRTLPCFVTPLFCFVLLPLSPMLCTSVLVPDDSCSPRHCSPCPCALLRAVAAPFRSMRRPAARAARRSESPVSSR